MDWLVQVKQLVDLGVTAVLVLTAIYAILRMYPQHLRSRQIDRQAMIELINAFAERLVAAQEKQADATTRLAALQSEHDGKSAEGMDALQIAIGSVEQHVSLCGKKIEDQGGLIEQLHARLGKLEGGIVDKLDQLLARR
jgi:hypothetical protein